MTIRALIFDLDGTLVHSLPDLAEAVNELMAANGLAPHAEPAVASMVGKGVPVLVQKAFAAHGVIVAGEVLDAHVKTYLGFYEPRATRLTRLFPHVADMVTELAKSYRLAVCTNKPTAVSREIVDSLGIGADIAVVVGGDSGVPAKPAPDMLWLVAERLGLAKDEVLMVGDSANDVASAKAAGITVAVVRYGYTDIAADDLKADFVMDDFRGLPAVLEQLVGRA
ncbi:MAG: cbbZC [Proteobacteria bacterium]|nr:cbbZC [Pseudomonadota bacterium]